jgi:hypothetical protein
MQINGVGVSLSVCFCRYLRASRRLKGGGGASETSRHQMIRQFWEKMLI